MDLGTFIVISIVVLGLVQLTAWIVCVIRYPLRLGLFDLKDQTTSNPSLDASQR